jgi:hypothetical protein
MKEPFAHVLYIEHDNDEHCVSVHQTLDEATAALRAYAAMVFVDGESLADDEIIETLATHNEYARIYACTVKRNVQHSAELVPFAGGKAAAA